MRYTCCEVLLAVICFTFSFFSVPGRVSAASLQLGWIDSSRDEDGFHIERKLGAGGTFSLVATTGPGMTFYSDSNLADGTTYCYRVNAFNSAGNSAYTNEACATTTSNSTVALPSSTLASPTSPPVVAPSSNSTVTQAAQTSTPSTSAVQPSTPPGTTVLSNANTSTPVRPVLGLNAAIEIGVFRPDTGEWFLDRNGNGQWDGCAVDGCVYSFGQAGDIAVTRKSANATLIGIFRQGTWIFSSNGTLNDCSLGQCKSFGVPGDLPVTGDWNRSGMEGIGVYRPSKGEWFLDTNGNGQWDGCDVDKCLGPFGADGDLPIVGDWNGTGKASIGIYRPSTGEWFLDTNGNGQWDGCDVDKCLGPFGADGDLPIVGDWNGTGKTSIGVYRPSTGDWFLDMNGNGNFDGCAVDACLGPFGQAGDAPVVGQW